MLSKLEPCQNCDKLVDFRVRVGGYMVCFSCEAKHHELYNKDGWR